MKLLLAWVKGVKQFVATVLAWVFYFLGFTKLRIKKMVAWEVD